MAKSKHVGGVQWLHVPNGSAPFAWAAPVYKRRLGIDFAQLVKIYGKNSKRSNAATRLRR